MRLYNSLSRKVEDLVPLEEGQVRMYACGPTVYRYAHIGNMRTFLLTDLVRRALEFEGYQVLQVMNITDVGHMVDESSAQAVDKMQVAMEDEGLQPLQIAEKYTQAFLEDTRAIGIEPAHRYPKATDHVDQMIAMTKVLVDRGHAYESEGSVYYDVRSFSTYGNLSGNTLDKLQPGHRDLEQAPGKRHHADFSLWKAAGPGRLMKWPSPWGEGFPGWHIECSAMSMEYLGDRFDIHTGGQDLKFPHHEDEIAQSEGAVGHEVVSIWLHGGFLRLGELKMAKSSGNVVRVKNLQESGYDPLSFRYLTFQSRYRKGMDFSLDAMHGADFKVNYLRRRMNDWKTFPRPSQLSAKGLMFDQRFRMAVSDDLDMPRALVVVNEVVPAVLSDGEKYVLLESWDHVLGLDLERFAREGFVVPPEILTVAQDRELARAQGDFAAADVIRDNLRALGWEVMDTPTGPRVVPTYWTGGNDSP
jgi:cysteinyl-tRNA synthetase